MRYSLPAALELDIKINPEQAFTCSRPPVPFRPPVVMKWIYRSVQLVQSRRARHFVQNRFTAENKQMINVDDESLITYAQAATLVPPNGVDRATISRWASLGIRGAVLRSWKIGGLRYTSHESLARFLDECNHRGTLHYVP